MTNPYAALSVSDKITEGRRRILTCLAQIGAEEDAVSLLELQKEYIKEFDQYLNKDELRRFFSKTHIKQVFENFMPKDVQMTTDVEQTGSLYLRLLRPLKVALAHGPFQQMRSTVQKIEKNPNLIPLPVERSKFDVLENELKKYPSDHRGGKGGNIKVTPLDENDNKLVTKKEILREQREREIVEEQKKNFLIYTRFSSSEDEGNDEQEESSQFGDDALEAGNQILSSAGNRTDLNREIQQNNKTVGIRTASHADKYLSDVIKKRNNRRVEQKNDSDESEDDEKLKYNQTLARLNKINNPQLKSIENAIAQKYNVTNTAKATNKHDLNYGNDLLESSDEDDDDPMIIMTEDGPKTENIKATQNSTPEEMHDMVDEQFYRQQVSAANTSTSTSNTLLGKGNVLPDPIRYYFMATIPFLVQMKMCIKASDLHAELVAADLLPYRTWFKMIPDLVKFVQQNCADMVETVEMANSDFIFLWKKKLGDKESTLNHLLQKVGKTLDKQE